MRGAAVLVLLWAAACPAGGARGPGDAPPPSAASAAAGEGIDLTLRHGPAGDSAVVVERRRVAVAAGDAWIELPSPGPGAAHVSVRVLRGEARVLGVEIIGAAPRSEDPGTGPARVRVHTRAPAAGEALVELAAATTGLTWRAEHELLVDGPDAVEADVHSVVVLAAAPGRAFTGARVEVVLEDATGRVRTRLTLPAVVDVPAGGEVRVPLGARRRPARRVVRFDATGGAYPLRPRELDAYYGTQQVPVRAAVELRLPDGGELLPGRARVLTAAPGGPVPVAETRLEADGPAGARVPLGDAAGLWGQRRRVSLDWAQGGEARLEERFEIQLRNDHDEALTVVVVEPMYRTPRFEVFEASVAPRAAGDRIVELEIVVPAHGRALVRYAVEYRW